MTLFQDEGGGQRSARGSLQRWVALGTLPAGGLLGGMAFLPPHLASTSPGVLMFFLQ